MTKTQIEEYLLGLEHKLLNEFERKTISYTRDWANSFPTQSAVYLFREEGEICYVGETNSIREKMNHIFNTRDYAVEKKSENKFTGKANSRKNLADELEVMLKDTVQEHLTLSYVLVDLGRKELEERLTVKFKPKYNLLDGEEKIKTYTKAEKQAVHQNAYEKWSIEDDEKLEKLFCERKTVTQLAETFGRNNGAIRSRIKKLELKEKYGLISNKISLLSVLAVC